MNQNMVDELLSVFPDFFNSPSYGIVKDDKDLPYSVYGVFSDFIINKINKLENNKTIITRFIDWINSVFNSEKYSTDDLNLLQITLFEPMTASKELIKFARSNLVGEALKHFNDTKRHFGIEE